MSWVLLMIPSLKTGLSVMNPLWRVINHCFVPDVILYIIPCISTHVLHPLKKSRICNVIIHYVLEPAKTNKICMCIEKHKYMFMCNVNNTNIYIYCHNKAWLCFPAIVIKLHINTLSETNMAPWKLITLDVYQRPWKWMVGRILPFWGNFGLFSAAYAINWSPETLDIIPSTILR